MGKVRFLQETRLTGGKDMAYITTEMLAEYSGKFPEEDSALPRLYVEAAMETVARYLHYNPEMSERSVRLWGDGSTVLVLPAPVQEVLSVAVDGSRLDISGCEMKKNYLSVRDAAGNPSVFPVNSKIDVAFRGGYDPVPLKIVTTALQLASLYQESAGGNLAVASTSFADQGTRVFNNFREDRFLDQINEWRIYNG